jgi:lipopolysaccharide transport system ATP-binding protein
MALTKSMSDILVSVQNLSKRYLVGHQSAKRERYTALRDVIGREARNFARKTVDFVRGRQIVQGDEVEEYWALKDVSFDVKRGEVFGIVGRNGAGKSTILKILSRITEPTEGRVILRGRVASLLEVGTGFHQELTGRENIFLNGAILGMARAEIVRKFDEIVAFAEVQEFLDTPVKRYSSGMYVRLAFAVAAHLEPEILVVDEVLAVGDVEFQEKCLGRMSDITKEGRTILFVSHNMGVIQRLCMRGLCLEKGRILYTGEINEVVDGYLGRVMRESLVNFPPRPGQPSITAIKIDQNELKVGNLIVDIEFTSPFPLVPPVPGIVVSSKLGVPLWGSNPLFHNKNYPQRGLKVGTLRMEARALPLASDNYHLSIWLSDIHVDYDHKPDILSFNFLSEGGIAMRPPNEIIGNLDWPASWCILSTKCA